MHLQHNKYYEQNRTIQPERHRFHLVGFQSFLIMVCVGIYAVLVQSIATSGDIAGAIWTCMGYTVLLCFALLKTGSLSKSLFGAH